MARSLPHDIEGLHPLTGEVCIEAVSRAASLGMSVRNVRSLDLFVVQSPRIRKVTSGMNRETAAVRAFAKQPTAGEVAFLRSAEVSETQRSSAGGQSGSVFSLWRVLEAPVQVG